MTSLHRARHLAGRFEIHKALQPGQNKNDTQRLNVRQVPPWTTQDVYHLLGRGRAQLSPGRWRVENGSELSRRIVKVLRRQETHATTVFCLWDRNPRAGNASALSVPVCGGPTQALLGY